MCVTGRFICLLVGTYILSHDHLLAPREYNVDSLQAAEAKTGVKRLYLAYGVSLLILLFGCCYVLSLSARYLLLC
jgi:hypothetical protein